MAISGGYAIEGCEDARGKTAIKGLAPRKVVVEIEKDSYDCVKGEGTRTTSVSSVWDIKQKQNQTNEKNKQIKSLAPRKAVVEIEKDSYDCVERECTRTTSVCSVWKETRTNK